MVIKEYKLGDVLTVSAASEEIGMHHVTLYRWIADGKVAYVQFGGIMFIPMIEVKRLKRERENKRAKVG